MRELVVRNCTEMNDQLGAKNRGASPPPQIYAAERLGIVPANVVHAPFPGIAVAMIEEGVCKRECAMRISEFEGNCIWRGVCRTGNLAGGHFGIVEPNADIMMGAL